MIYILKYERFYEVIAIAIALTKYISINQPILDLDSINEQEMIEEVFRRE